VTVVARYQASDQVDNARSMAAMRQLLHDGTEAALRRLASEQEVDVLADWLRAAERSSPVVLISTRARQPSPLIGAERVAEDLAGVADVFLIQTGSHTFRLSELLGEYRSVSGGAARVYPPGTGWLDQPRDAPLIFTYHPDEAPRSERRVIRVSLSVADGSYSAIAEPSTPARGSTKAPASPPRSSAGAAARSTVDLPPRGPLTYQLGRHVDPDVASRLQEALTEAAGRQHQVAPAPSPAAAPAPLQTSAAETKRTLVEGLKHSLEEERARVRRLTSEAASLTRQLDAQKREADARREREAHEFRVQLATEREKTRATTERARVAGSAARKAQKGGGSQPAEAAPVLDLDKFATPEHAVRHAIYLAWVERVPATEKADHPLPEYEMGAELAPSLLALRDGQLAKALRCAVDMLTGMGETMHSRRVHPLRESAAGNSGIYTDDRGAVCMRAYIEADTASARRLHYWKLPDGSIELIRIVLHDVVEP